MEEDTTLYLQLQKLSAANSEKSLDSVLSALWRTRRTGVRSAEKSRIRSLLNSPSISELDPVLACLRSLIRKCVHENYAEDDLMKLFPPDIPLDLKKTLVLVLLKHKNQWREELSKELVRVSLPSTSINLRQSEASTSTRPYQDDPSFSFDRSSLGSVTLIAEGSDVSVSGTVASQRNDSASEPPASLPRLKSMSWTMETSKASSSKVAHITLKLEDHASSPSGEREVKFQLTKDTFEAMLHSMTNISHQLSTKVGDSPEPVQKKQKQAS